MTDIPTPFYQRRPLAVVVATLAFIVAVAIALAMLAHTFVKPAHAEAPPVVSADGWRVCSDAGGTEVLCTWGSGALPIPTCDTVPPPDDPGGRSRARAQVGRGVRPETCSRPLRRATIHLQ